MTGTPASIAPSRVPFIRRPCGGRPPGMPTPIEGSFMNFRTVPALTLARVDDITLLSFTAAAAYQTTTLFTWLMDDPQERRRRLPGYFRALLARALTAGSVYTDHRRSMVAVWLPVTRGQPPALVDDNRLVEATGPWAPRFRHLHTLLAAHHPTGAAHEWLTLLAVDPVCQRRGAASALLDHYHALLDRDGTPTCVWVDVQHRELFLRRGYKELGEPISLPAGPDLATMWRNPNPSGLRPSRRPGRRQPHHD